VRSRLTESACTYCARAGGRSRPPRSGGESDAAANEALDEYLHLYLANRGVLITPFHNMALMCPATTDADVDAHTELFAAAADDLLA